jgi:hypothetical protein
LSSQTIFSIGGLAPEGHSMDGIGEVWCGDTTVPLGGLHNIVFDNRQEPKTWTLNNVVDAHTPHRVSRNFREIWGYSYLRYTSQKVHEIAPIFLSQNYLSTPLKVKCSPKHNN